MCHPCCCVQVAIPVYVRHSLNWLGGTQGRFDITVGPKQTMGRTVEKVISLFQLINLKCSNPLSNNQVKIEIAMHKSVLNCSLTPTQGKYSFDPVSTKDLERKSNIHHTLILIPPLLPCSIKVSVLCQVSKLLSWDVGKIDASKLPNLRGSVNLITGATPEPTNPSIRWVGGFRTGLWTPVLISAFNLL